MQNLIIPPEEVCLITLHCYLGTSVFAKIDVFFLEKVQMAFAPPPPSFSSLRFFRESS